MLYLKHLRTIRQFYSNKLLIIAVILIFFVRYCFDEDETIILKQYQTKFKPSTFLAVVRQYETPVTVVDFMKKSWLKRFDDYQIFAPFERSNEIIKLPSTILNDNPGVLIKWLSQWAMSLSVGQQFDFYLLTFDTSYLIAHNFRRDLLHVDNNKTIYAFLGNETKDEKTGKTKTYAIVLNKAAIKFLATNSGDELIKCISKKEKLCDCLDELGLTSVNLSTDVNGQAKYLHVTRHFTRGEMQITKEKLGSYNDGKEIFEKLSPDMIAFFDINPLEHVILDNFLYRLNKQEL